jgi:D-inositol-3-phosphate glycosyltransferase
MRITLIGPAYPYRGGIASFTERLALAFEQQGASVNICTFTLQYPNFLFPGSTQFSSDAAPAGLDIKRCISSVNPLSWWQVGRQLQQQRPDVLVTQFWLPFMAPALGSIHRLAHRNKHTRIVGITHNVLPHEKRVFDNQLTNYFVQSCDGFVAMSRSVLNDLAQFTSNTNKMFIPHPIYDNFGEKVAKTLARKQLGINENEKVILFFGLIRQYKGLDWLLEAMNNPQVRSLNIKLLVAGEYYESAELYEQLIAKYSLQDNVLLHTRFIPNDEVKYYFSAADMVVQPYRRATQSGISQMAYHFERPMLVTNVGGLPEIVPHNHVGYVTEPNPTAIAAAIVSFYAQNREQEFAQNVAAQKHLFSWQAMTEGILQLAKTPLVK